MLLIILNSPSVEQVSQDADQELGHPVLLLQAAVVLNREDERKVRSLKSIFLASLHNILEYNLRCESVAVVDDRLTIIAIPAVQLNTSAAKLERVDVSINTALTSQLVTSEISEEEVETDCTDNDGDTHVLCDEAIQ